MKYIIYFLILVLPLVAFSHEGHHGHGSGNPYKDFDIKIEKQQAIDFSKSVIDKLVENDKLTKDWSKASYVTAEQKVFKEELEWVVSFRNEKAKAPKDTIFIFLSIYGDFRGANFTGN